MKNAVSILVFGVLLTGLCHGQDNRAWVRVKTENKMRSKLDTITFVISDGYTSQTKTSLADENGVFLASFNVSNSIDILWGFGRKATLPLIITPDDTIHITILSEKDGILFGKRARTCANLMEMYEAGNRPRVQAYESEYTPDPTDFVDFMNERLNAHLKFANKFCKSTECTKTFVTWYIKSAYVSYYRNLADYCHSLQRTASIDAVQRNNFLRARDVILNHIDLNDPTLEMSSGYYDLLKSIFSLYVTPQELRSIYYSKATDILLQKKLTEADARALRRIQSGTRAESDLAVLTRLSNKYKEDVTGALRNAVDPSIQLKFAEIKDPDVRDVIIAYYKGIWDWI